MAGLAAAPSDMQSSELILFAGAVMVIAFLYSSVGHAGASGYIAVMALFSFSPEEIRPVALSLNVMVATITTWQFYRAGHFSWPLFWPFAALAIPCAFVGGYLSLPTRFFNILVGVVLLFSAIRFFVRPTEDVVVNGPSRKTALAIGGGLGLLSGLTGTGGGIFLTPLLLMKRWARAKPAAAVSALFILMNSCAGLAGNLHRNPQLPPVIGVLALAAILGGTLGSYLGSHRFNHTMIKKLLAIVLVIAGIKLMFT